MADPVARVVIFGATSAIAQAVGRRLAARGASLFLVARDPARLAAVAADLEVRGARVTGLRAVDLDRPEGHAGTVAAAAAALGEVDLALVAQGVLGDQAACEADPVAAARVLTANLVGPATLCQEVGGLLGRQGHGVLAAISSVAGERGRPSNYVYGAAKGGLSTFLEGLRARLHRSGVSVLTVKPGFVDTPMTAHLPRNPLFTSPEAVADRILAAAEGRRDVIYVPRFWWAIMLVIRLLPRPLFKRLSL